MRGKLKEVNRTPVRAANGEIVEYFYAWKGGPRLAGPRAFISGDRGLAPVNPYRAGGRISRGAIRAGLDARERSGLLRARAGASPDAAAGPAQDGAEEAQPCRDAGNHPGWRPAQGATGRAARRAEPLGGRAYSAHRTRHTMDGERLSRLVAQGLYLGRGGRGDLPRSARHRGYAIGARGGDPAGDRNGHGPLAPRRPPDPGFPLSQPRSRPCRIGNSEARKRLIIPTKRPTDAIASSEHVYSLGKVII